MCILLHLVGVLLTLNYDARNHELKIYDEYICVKTNRCEMVRNADPFAMSVYANL